MQNDQNNWSFVEIFFVFLIVIIIIANFLFLLMISEKNNTVSYNHFRATQLVQERMKFMVDMKEKNMEKLLVINGNFYNWSQLFDGLITFPPCNNSLDPDNDCGDFILTQCPSGSNIPEKQCFVNNPNPSNTSFWKIQGDAAPFSQKIRISEAGENTRKITVFIWWTDKLGPHKSLISRVFKK